jgi:hypothetical protein
MLTITNLVAMLIFEVISGKFNAFRISVIGNYEHKWMT